MIHKYGHWYFQWNKHPPTPSILWHISILLREVLHPKWHPIDYFVHYFWPWLIGLWSKVLHYIGNREEFGYVYNEIPDNGSQLHWLSHSCLYDNIALSCPYNSCLQLKLPHSMPLLLPEMTWEIELYTRFFTTFKLTTQNGLIYPDPAYTCTSGYRFVCALDKSNAHCQFNRVGVNFFSIPVNSGSTLKLFLTLFFFKNILFTFWIDWNLNGIDPNPESQWVTW